MQKTIFHHHIILLLSIIIAGCASIGSPDGGAYDETPPKVVKCVPANMSVNNNKKKISLTFDEYINLEKATEKVVISPPQVEMPEINTSGKKINITLFDSLQSNTTYTIDFSDAIVDFNEGNPMGNFTYSFATGNHIDSMEVSGILLEAENLEPIKGLLVGLYSDLSDSAFTTKPIQRVSRTNSKGEFIIKGIAPGKYRIYALNDMDANFYYSQKSEKLAFVTIIIEPKSQTAYRQDTVWIDSTRIDTIKNISYTHFTPDNIVLRGFTEDFQNLHLLKVERPIPDKFSIYFTGPSDTIPKIKGLNFSGVENIILESSLHHDTLTYWITDTLVSNMDTLSISMTYLDTDTLNQLVYRTDTLDITPKITRSRQRKELQEKIKEWEKAQEKLKKRQKEKYEAKPNPYLREELVCQVKPSSQIAPNQNVTLTFDEPIAEMDSSAFHFYKKKDTLWIKEPYLLLPTENSMRSYTLYAEWQPGEKYKFEADSNAVRSIIGKVSAPIKKEISVSPEDVFGSLFIKLILPDTGAVVQLLDNSDKVIRETKAVDNRADFYYLQPKDYYIRLYIDKNGDGKWTTGTYESGTQPEEVFYFPKPITLKALWEIEQDWNVRGIPIEKQKPEAITKQKPEAEKKIKQRNAERNKNR